MAYDVSTLLHVPWHAAPAVYGWAEICNLVRHLPTASATWRAMHPELAPWAEPLALVNVTADVFNAIAALAHLYAGAHSKGRRPAPKPYPVPWAEEKGIRYGRGAIPAADFDAWYYSEEA